MNDNSATQQLDLAGSQPHTQEYAQKLVTMGCCGNYMGYGMLEITDAPDYGSYSHPDKMPGIHFNGNP